MKFSAVLVVPLAGNHAEVVTCDGAEVSDRVVTAVNIDESLIERHIEHGQLVVVAEKTLQEGLVGEIKRGEVVVGAIDILDVRATFY